MTLNEDIYPEQDGFITEVIIQQMIYFIKTMLNLKQKSFGSEKKWLKAEWIKNVILKFSVFLFIYYQ